jgi:hypothetical protein
MNLEQSNGHLPPCTVADTMNRMNGFEDKVIENAIKETASIAFARTQTEELPPPNAKMPHGVPRSRWNGKYRPRYTSPR